MKIRKGFVTNSSSTSYICVYKLKCTVDQVKDEFGKFGTKIIDNYAITDLNTIVENELKGDTYMFESDIENCICDICNECLEDACENTENEDCQYVKDQLPAAFKALFEDSYCKIEDGKVYLIGHASQGYGGDYDVSDDQDVMLGKLLQDLGMATCEYMGEPY